jgi:membrane associated rhomboid family serine protease
MGLLYLFKNMPIAVKNLLIINLLFFVSSIVFESAFQINLIHLLGMKYFGSVEFSPIQIFTHMFMHGGFSHILFNMFGLLMFGSVVERYIGTPKFLLLYLVAGLGAALSEQMYWGYQVFAIAETYFPDAIFQKEIMENLLGRIPMTPANNELALRMYVPMVGASGAVYGLLAAYAFFFPNSELMLIFFPFPIKAKYFVPGLMAIDLFMGVSNHSWDKIAHFAHFGGAVVGFVLVYLWRRNRRV